MAGDFKVQVRVNGPHPELDRPIYRLCVATDFLCEVDVSTPEFARTLSLLNRVPAVFAACTHPTSLPKAFEKYGPPEKFGLDLKSSRIWLASSAYLNESIKDWLPRFFGSLAVLQPIEAQFRAHLVAPLLRGRLDHSRPSRGPRSGVDDILGVEEDIARAGLQESRWRGTGEFEGIVNRWASESVFGVADPTGLSIETPFGEETAMVRLYVDQPHPRLGNGLFAKLALPFLSNHDQAAAFAIELNHTEDLRWIPHAFPFIGSWFAVNMHETKGTEYFAPVFLCFIPNLAYSPGVAENLALYCVARARWVRESFFPQLKDHTLEAIFSRRLGIGTPQHKRSTMLGAGSTFRTVMAPEALKWIEAGKLLASDPSAVVRSPGWDNGMLRVPDVTAPGGSAMERYLVCESCERGRSCECGDTAETSAAQG